MQKTNLRLGELLLYAGKISREQLNEAIEIQKTTKMKLGEIIVSRGWLKPEEIVEALERQLVRERNRIYHYLKETIDLIKNWQDNRSNIS